MEMSSKDEKSVKKEETEENEDDNTLNSILKAKRNAATQMMNGTLEATHKTVGKIQKKKHEDNNVEEAKPIVKKVSKKSQKAVALKEKKFKKKKQKELEEKASRKNKKLGDGNKKMAKEAYDLPGQKHHPPEKRDPLRIFYETLYQQLPDSEMASFWMMEWGLLPLEEAKRVYERKLKSNQQLKLNLPVKDATVKRTSVAVTKKTNTSKVTMKVQNKCKVSSTSENGEGGSNAAKKMPKKRKADKNSDDDDDFAPAGTTSKKQKMDVSVDDGDDDFTPTKKKIKKQKVSS